jgi:hypothetical protein
MREGGVNHHITVQLCNGMPPFVYSARIERNGGDRDGDIVAEYKGPSFVIV